MVSRVLVAALAVGCLAGSIARAQDVTPTMGASRPVDDLLLVGHNGANRGWHAAMWIVPETGDGLVVVTNGSNGGAVQQQLWCDWVESMTGSRPDCPKPISTALVGTLLAGDVDTAIRRYRRLKAEQPDGYDRLEAE